MHTVPVWDSPLVDYMCFVFVCVCVCVCVCECMSALLHVNKIDLEWVVNDFNYIWRTKYFERRKEKQICTLLSQRLCTIQSWIENCDSNPVELVQLVFQFNLLTSVFLLQII